MKTYYSSPTEVMPRAKEAALRALELNPNLASARVKLGDVHLLFRLGLACGGKGVSPGAGPQPKLARSSIGYATYLATLGASMKRSHRVQQAYLFDPLALESRNEALWIYYFSGPNARDREQAQKTIELNLRRSSLCDARAR